VSGTQLPSGSGSKTRFRDLDFRRYVTVRTFLGILGFVYFIAFLSFGIQAMGLIGSRGISPAAEYLNAARESAGRTAWWYVPTLLWFNPSDTAIRGLWIFGVSVSVLAAVGRLPRVLLAGCLILWLSICTAGQDFFSFQWDVLLLEAGFLAIFADSSRLRVWLFRWLLFRLMFFSGLIKLLSHDVTWRNLTALSYHYETQPLPTPVAWYMHQLPMGFQKASTLFVFLAELIVPFLFFAPKRVRHIGAWITIGLQLLIMITGNYAFFNMLTIALTMFLFIDSEKPAIESRTHRAVSVALVVFIGGLSALQFLELFSVELPPGGAEIMHLVAPLRIVNSYGLFANMTTTRPEIIMEGSNDGANWLAYEFPYKPGDPLRAPPVVAPHQPRLDWQMWFAALGTYQQNRWFVDFVGRLLHGEPSVLRLLRYNPFPTAPPKYIRARLYLYHFTDRRQRGWWTREERGLYFPAVSLK
jgi:hypothetical protein